MPNQTYQNHSDSHRNKEEFNPESEKQAAEEAEGWDNSRIEPILFRQKECGEVGDGVVDQDGKSAE